MIEFVGILFLSFLAPFTGSKLLAAENMALRHQVSVLRRKHAGRMRRPDAALAAGPYLLGLACEAVSFGSRRHNDRQARDRSTLVQIWFLDYVIRRVPSGGRTARLSPARRQRRPCAGLRSFRTPASFRESFRRPHAWCPQVRIEQGRLRPCRAAGVF